MAITLFSYRRGSSVLHKCPALVKLALLFALCLFVFGGSSVTSFNELLSHNTLARLIACLASSFVLFALSGGRPCSIKRVNFVFVFGAFVTLSRMIHIPLFFDAGALAYGVSYTARFFAASLAAEVVFETTSPVEISEALEYLQDTLARVIPPLKKVRVAQVLSLAINFVPEVFATWNKVSLAAKARGAARARGKVQVMLQEFTSLFSCLLRFAEVKRMAILNRSGSS